MDADDDEAVQSLISRHRKELEFLLDRHRRELALLRQQRHRHRAQTAAPPPHLNLMSQSLHQTCACGGSDGNPLRKTLADRPMGVSVSEYDLNASHSLPSSPALIAKPLYSNVYNPQPADLHSYTYHPRSPEISRANILLTNTVNGTEVEAITTKTTTTNVLTSPILASTPTNKTKGSRKESLPTSGEPKLSKRSLVPTLSTSSSHAGSGASAPMQKLRNFFSRAGHKHSPKKATQH